MSVINVQVNFDERVGNREGIIGGFDDYALQKFQEAESLAPYFYQTWR